MRLISLFSLMILAAAGCTTTVNNTTNTTAGSNNNTGTGDKTTNTGSVSAKGSDGSSTSVSANAPATKDSASGTGGGKQLGAMATDKILTLYISDANSLITITIDTEKHPLPAKGIPAGDFSSGASVTYLGTAGNFGSDGSGGTIDVSNCPSDANNTVTVGTLNGVVVKNNTPGVPPGAPDKLTLDGTFNLVYYGGYGQLKCTAPAKTETDAGSTGGSDTTSGGGGTCGYTVCADSNKNCCPFMPCLLPCEQKCATDFTTCSQGCMANPMDPSCGQNCVTDAAKCDDACVKSCKVSDSCKTAYTAAAACQKKADDTSCGAISDEQAKTTCEIDACCAEVKAAF